MNKIIYAYKIGVINKKNMKIISLFLIMNSKANRKYQDSRNRKENLKKDNKEKD